MRSIFTGAKNVAEQNRAYYAQGRKPLDEVNELRKKAGLYLLRSEKDNKDPIMQTLVSKHMAGLAMDVVPLDGGGKPTWDLGHYEKQFKTIRDCGRAAGLVCGADWKWADWPHYEAVV